MKTFHEILPDFLAGKKIRRKSWENKNLFFILIDGCIVTQDGDKASNIATPAILATDWELYEEPAPEPEAEKTLAQFIFEFESRLKWEDFPEFHGKYSEYALALQAEVLRRHRESLPKIEGKTAGQVFWELLYEQSWHSLYEFDKQLFEAKATRFLSAYQLAPPEPKAEQRVLSELEYKEAAKTIWTLLKNQYGDWERENPSVRKVKDFLSPYLSPPPEPKAESAVERLFNSGFGMSRLFQVDGQSNARIESFGQAFEGKGETPELAAAAAIDQFKNYIAGI